MAYTKELTNLLKQSQNAYRAMKPDLSKAHATRIYAKPAKESRLLHAMDSLENLELSGVGTLEMSDKVLYDGKPTVLMCPPAQFTIERLAMSRMKVYGDTHTLVKFPCEDWRDYNRLTFEIFPDLPNYDNVYFLITLVNDRKEDYERSGLLADTLILQLNSGEWNRVVWEIPNTHRDRIVGIQLRCTVDGRQQGSDLWKRFYFGPIHLEKVDEDFYEGWELNDRIAFCHVGYEPGMPKLAYTQDTTADAFALLCAESGEVVYTAPVKKLTTGFGDYVAMDFSEFNESGEYVLKVGEQKTGKFQIDNEAYASPIWKALNFFYQERCGCEVEGVHRVCHLDTYAEHPDGRLVCSGGGWHDAGDMSQGLCNTSESAHAMLDLALRVKNSDPKLYNRLIDEARWGLDWCMKTRFGDGYRARWTRVGTWTNNILGDMDDLVLPAEYDPFENFCGAGAEAAGYEVFRESDSAYAEYCLKCAIEDFNFAYKRAFQRGINTQTIGQGAVAAGTIYKVCGDEDILKKGAILAKIVLECQQQEMPDWDVPIRGFFYNSNRAGAEPMAYNHRAHEQAPVMGLARMYEAAPNHPDAPKWKEGLALYGEYIKTIEKYTQPYGLLPNAIYRLGSGRNSEVFDGQIRSGIRLSDEYYLRIFPIATDFRGYNGTCLTKAKCVTQAARILGDEELNRIAQRQVEWILGMNPFAQCTMYGEGYNYPDLFVMFSHQLVGGVPVGIWTDGDHDCPNFPQMNNAVYKEVWVHTTSRLLWVLADLYGDGEKKVECTKMGEIEHSHANAQTGEAKVICALDSYDGFTFRGPGYAEISDEQTCFDKPTLKMIAPNTLIMQKEPQRAPRGIRMPEPRLDYGTSEITVDMGGCDLSAERSISVWVFADCGGYQSVNVELSLTNITESDGEKQTDTYTKKFKITNGKWHKLAWNITDLPRNCVGAVSVVHPLTGAQANMADHSTLYLSMLAAEKTAVYEATGKCDCGCCGSVTWQDKAWDKLSELRSKRCGYGVPGVHIPCHEDCFAVHPDGRLAPIGGGWHDVGDFSHEMCITAETVTELMELAGKAKDNDSDLYYALIDEARHGLEWMLRTRFEDGYRCVSAPIAVWTKGIIGDGDDIKIPANNDPFANFKAAAVEAEASKVYAEHDITLSRYALKCAEEDFRFAYERMNLPRAQYGMKYQPNDVDMYGVAASAAASLYAVSGNADYKAKLEMLEKLAAQKK